MIYFQSPEYLHLIWLIFPLLYLFLRALRKKRTALSLFTGGLDSSENSFQMRGYAIASILILVALIIVIFSLARPSWNKQTRTVEKKGHDVVFLIDVSRSMLADDLIPNRLERAKLALIDAVGSLDGDRVALVAFAGNAVVKTPLTNDYSFFISAVERLEVGSVSKGGSLIGDAIRYTLSNVLGEGTKASRDIILITDGEDQESFPIEAAKEADSQGVRIISIGLGDEQEGRRIPLETDKGREFLSFEGKEIWTKLDAAMLRGIAGATEGGRYLNVSTGTFDLAEIYSTLQIGRDETVDEEQDITLYEERFQLFLFLSITLLSFSLFQPFRGWKYLISYGDFSRIRRIVRK